MNCNSIMANKHLTKNSNKNKSKLGTLNLHIFVDRYDSLSQINIYYHSLTIIYHIYPQIYLDLYITNTKQNKTKNNGNIFLLIKNQHKYFTNTPIKYNILSLFLQPIIIHSLIH